MVSLGRPLPLPTVDRVRHLPCSLTDSQQSRNPSTNPKTVYDALCVCSYGVLTEMTLLHLALKQKGSETSLATAGAHGCS